MSDHAETAAILLDMQRQLNELSRRERARAKRKGKRRSAAYDPPTPPGPVPSEIDIARAKRLLRGER